MAVLVIRVWSVFVHEISYIWKSWRNLMPYRRLTFITLLFTFHWLLLACGSMTIKDTTTQSYIPIQGWILELHQNVVIPPGRTRVFFQGGRLLYAVNEYKPHCQLRVRDISEQPQTVHADRFTIDKVFGSYGEIVSNDRILLAAAGAVVIAGGGNGNGENRRIYFYHMGLHADKQPHVSYLVCGGGSEQPYLADYPSIQDIYSSMGDYATLILPGDG